MTGIEALQAYGYVLNEETGRLVRPGKNTQEWQPAEDGGFLRFDGGVQVPFTVNETGQGLAGMDSANPAHRSFFEWVWPDEEITRIYAPQE